MGKYHSSPSQCVPPLLQLPLFHYTSEAGLGPDGSAGVSAGDGLPRWKLSLGGADFGVVVWHLLSPPGKVAGRAHSLGSASQS